MNIHEFGVTNTRVLVLVHPSIVMWDYFDFVIPLLERNYHLYVPALPGYDPDDDGNFTSVETIATELEDFLLSRGHREISCIYGCSMGGSIAIRMLANGRVRVQNAAIDGGITPYSLPWIVTRFIALRDFLMVYAGKFCGVGLLRKAFSTDDYTEDDIRYIKKMLDRTSAKTIWRTFDSCNNYSMPAVVQDNCENIEYWFADAEEKARKWDIGYMKRHFPGTKFIKMEGIGHGGLAVLHPEEFVRHIARITKSESLTA